MHPFWVANSYSPCLLLAFLHLLNCSPGSLSSPTPNILPSSRYSCLLLFLLSFRYSTISLAFLSRFAHSQHYSLDQIDLRDILDDVPLFLSNLAEFLAALVSAQCSDTDVQCLQVIQQFLCSLNSSAQNRGAKEVGLILMKFLQSLNTRLVWI